MREEFNNYRNFGHFLWDYEGNVDVGRVMVIWVTFLIIGVIFLVIRRAKEIRDSLNNVEERSEKSSFLDAVHENNENERKSEMMMSYHKTIRVLHIAAERCYLKEYEEKCIDIVLKHPTLVNWRCSSTGLTPFHQVCSHGNSKLIYFMLAYGADVSIETKSKENPLCLLIRSYLQPSSNTDLSCLNILRDAGCSVKRGDKWYKILLESALLNNNEQLALWILEQSSKKIEKQRSFP